MALEQFWPSQPAAAERQPRQPPTFLVKLASLQWWGFAGSNSELDQLKRRSVVSADSQVRKNEV